MIWTLSGCIWVTQDEVADKRLQLERSVTDSGNITDETIVPDDTGPTDLPRDEDGDGFFDTDDCDDANAAVHPDATESIGDNTDTDCDGMLDQFPAAQELGSHTGPTAPVARDAAFGPIVGFAAEVTREDSDTLYDTVSAYVFERSEPDFQKADHRRQYYYSDQAIMGPFDVVGGYDGTDPYLLFMNQQINSNRWLILDIKKDGSDWAYIDAIVDKGAPFDDIDLLLEGTNFKATACAGKDIKRIHGQLQDVRPDGEVTVTDLTGPLLHHCKTTGVGVLGAQGTTPPTFYVVDGTKLISTASSRLMEATVDLDLVETETGMLFAAVGQDEGNPMIVFGTSADGTAIKTEESLETNHTLQTVSLTVTQQGHPMACATTTDSVFLVYHRNDTLVLEDVTANINAPRGCAIQATADHLILAVREGSSRVVGTVAPLALP